MTKFDWSIKIAKVINLSYQLCKNGQPGVAILILNLQKSSKNTNFPFEKVICNNFMKTDGFTSHKNNTKNKLQTALLGHQFISEGRTLPTESPVLPACCQVLPSKHLIVLGTSSWQLLLELCDLTLRRTKLFASIILLISGEVRRQRIHIGTHSVVMEPNIYYKKNIKKYLLYLTLHTLWEQIKITFCIPTSAFGCRPQYDLYNNKLVTRRGFGHG